MSQEKVNRYKESKGTRKELETKAKRKRLITKVVGYVVAVALVCWLGYSVYEMATRPDTTPIELDATALEDYLSELYETEAAE